MNILTWLKEVTTGGHPEFIGSGGMTFAEGEEQFHGLNMKAALDAHVDWTHRLERKLNGENSEELEEATVGSNCNYKLGKWIHGVMWRHLHRFLELGSPPGTHCPEASPSKGRNRPARPPVAAHASG